jgi:zinc protease
VKIARGLKQIQLARLPIDYIEKRNAMVSAVTVEDVKRVARRILDDGELLVAAVGKPVGFREGRSATGTETLESVPAAAPTR